MSEPRSALALCCIKRVHKGSSNPRYKPDHSRGRISDAKMCSQYFDQTRLVLVRIVFGNEVERLNRVSNQLKNANNKQNHLK